MRNCSYRDLKLLTSLQLAIVLMAASRQITDDSKAMRLMAIKSRYRKSEEMSNLTISFGEAQKGKTFSDVMITDIGWVQWFMSLSDPSECQMLFKHYLNLLKEESEDDSGQTASMTASSAAWELAEPNDYAAKLQALKEDVKKLRTSCDGILKKLEELNLSE